jgi:hypothetical protein
MLIALTLSLIAFHLAGTFAGFRAIAQLERAISEAIRTRALIRLPPPPPPPAFVSLLLIGEDDRGAQILAGASEVLTGTPGESKQLELTAQVPVKRAFAVVLCDASRVSVQIFKGHDLMAASVGDCPMGRVGDVELGVKVRALAYLRVPS